MEILDNFVRWFFHTGGIFVSLGILEYKIIMAARHRRLSTWFVLALSSTTLFWLEPFGDWGAYVLYDPTLPQMPWGPTPFTAPSKPWGILPGYVWFYLFWTLITVPIVSSILAKKPQWSPAWVCFLTTIPLWFVFDVAIEYTMISSGVWTYVVTFGPVLTSAKGSFPLLWPLLMQVPFMAFLTWLLYVHKQDKHGLTPIDRFIPITRSHENEAWDVKYEVARVVTWIVIMHVLFITTVIAPLILWRLYFGIPSSLIP